MGTAIPIPRANPPLEAERRLRRLRSVAWLLDRSIPVGPWRIGLDPIVGLLPGAGDWIGAVLSLYVLYQAARLGLPFRVLSRMGGNLLLEAIVGTVPVIGDAFDFVWQANYRNVKLVEQYYRPDMPARSFRKIWVVVALVAAAMLGLLGAALYFAVKGVTAVLG